ncbi:MAG TPA: acetate--CoA ligase family protein, partial [Hyphomicrobiaceae bacterium]|nr:acetate--CoA ligase family protein [Hyphomicrobiaceae bacterium]
PFSADDALAALRALRCWPVLAGTRGERAADVAAIAEAAVAVGELVRKSSARILSLDINPLIVGSEGYAVVDAVVVREES